MHHAPIPPISQVRQRQSCGRDWPRTNQRTTQLEFVRLQRAQRTDARWRELPYGFRTAGSAARATKRKMAKKIAEREGLFAAAPLNPRGSLGTVGARARRRPSPPLRGGSSNPIVYVLGFESHRDDHSGIAIPVRKPFKKIGGERGIRTLEGLLTLTPLAGPIMNPPLSIPLWESGYLEPFCPPLSIAVPGRLSVPFRTDSFLPMADLSRKRSRDRLAPRREPYRQRLAAGAYLSFR